jgi:hypothetical protein
MDILKRKGGRFSIRFSVRFSFFSPLQCTVQYSTVSLKKYVRGCVIPEKEVI